MIDMRKSPALPTMEKLSDEVLTEILIRLPAKSIAQKRCVSKPWNALLSEPSFIKSHLNRSIHNNDEVFLVFNTGFFDDREPLTVVPSKSSNLIKFPVNPFDSHTGKVIGSVNGLICFHRDSYDHLIQIWNPSLGALCSLPPCPHHDQSHAFFRFGYDPKTDDYKVVKVTGRVGVPDCKTAYDFLITPSLVHVLKESMQVEVYSMRKGSWELIPQRFPWRVSCLPNRNEVSIDGLYGHLHWLCIGIGLLPPPRKIVTFDLGAETFGEISLPDSLSRPSGLGYLAGKLCVFSGTMNTTSELEVWVMEEYGVAESWVKSHVLSQFSRINPFGFTLKDKFVFGPYRSRHLALYDPSSAKVKSFEDMTSKLTCLTKVVPYIDSLVWVTPAAKSHISLNNV